jgi:hypothetical protein
MLKMNRTRAEEGKLFVLFRGESPLAGSVTHTRVYKSFVIPPNRAYIYAYIALTNWSPQLHYFALCRLSVENIPPVAVPDFPFDVEMHLRPIPFAPRYPKRTELD